MCVLGQVTMEWLWFSKAKRMCTHRDRWDWFHPTIVAAWLCGFWSELWRCRESHIVVRMEVLELLVTSCVDCLVHINYHQPHYIPYYGCWFPKVAPRMGMTMINNGFAAAGVQQGPQWRMMMSNNGSMTIWLLYIANSWSCHNGWWPNNHFWPYDQWLMIPIL